MHCDIYRSSKKEEMYIYIPCDPKQEQTDEDPLANVSDAIKQAFGRATFVMRLELSEARKLARVNVLHVMDSLATKGFFLQMPPDGLINPNQLEPEGLRGA